MKYVVFYESADNVAERAPAHLPAHRARLEEYHGRGDLVMIGTFGDPQAEGSMGIFRTRGAAESFVAGDPFVLHGVIRAYTLREWNEILVPDDAATV
ncbi:YciI family protein [Cryptosporangium sp. NPDC051539]|uniref:YciI family protein n=1 Tax=Cryptosporangium sp. NPDC051539 TaxID=3363962 RepID=UPI00379FAB71